MPAVIARRGWLLGAAALALAGCGFRLRGPMTLPFSTLRTNLTARTELGRELRAQLAASGVRVLDPAPLKPQQPVELADVVLDSLLEQRERAVVGMTATGQVREIQLRLRLRFRVRTGAGRDLIAETELLQERDLGYDESQVIGKQAEEEMLFRDMQADLARQLMRRLAAIKP